MIGSASLPARGRIARACSCVLLISAAVVGCDSATGVDGAMQIEITAASPVLSVVTQPDGPRLVCDVPLHARTSGSAGATARWMGATMLVAYGFDRSVFVDSLRMGAVEVQQAWGSAEVRVGEDVSTTFTLVAGLPTSAELEIRYLVAGESQPRTITVPFDCGPRPSSSGGAEPRFEKIDTDPAAGDVDYTVGPLVNVSYRATSEVGIWFTALEVLDREHPRVHRIGGFAQAVDEQIPVTLPRGPLGEQFRVRLYAVDIAGQMSVSVPSGVFTIVDKTPPRFVSAGFYAGPLDHPFRAQFAHTDTMLISVQAMDNHLLQHVGFEIGGPVAIRDSVHAPGPMTIRQFSIPMRDEWIGSSPQVSVFARDAAGNTSGRVGSGEGDVHIYPELVRPLRSLWLPSAPLGVSYDDARDRLLLTYDNPSRLEELSLGQLESRVVAALPARGISVDVDATGTTAIVALPEILSVAVVDLSGSEPSVHVERLPQGWLWLQAVKFLANGRALIVGQIGGPGAIAEFDPVEKSFTTRAQPGGVPSVGMVARSEDRSTVLFGFGGSCGLVRYDLDVDTFSSCLPRAPAVPSRFRATAPGSVSGAGSTIAQCDRSARTTSVATWPVCRGMARPSTCRLIRA
jgi:hypothetical protein